MSDQAAVTARVPARSMGLKLLLVCGLALLMAIPALFVFALLSDRTSRAEEVTRELGELMGGPQTFLGPVIAVPYVIPAAPSQAAVQGVYLIYPADAQAVVSTATEVRRRSLFKTPVYRADLAFDAAFDLTATPIAAPQGATLDWSRAEFLLGVSDPRGAQSDIALKVGDATLQLAPATTVSEQTVATSPDGLSARGPGGPAELRFFGASAANLATPGARLAVQTQLKFTGAQRIAILPYGKTTRLTVKGDWADPSFDGGFLPVRRNVGEAGFTADWKVPFIARGVPAEGAQDTLSRLGQTALGVSFVEPANPYQSVSRSLKYAPLFLGLVFLAYFLFEVMTGQRVHPAQYVLIGLAQLIFYLLLLSIAERTGFDIAFGAAAVATVGLISAYAGWVFESRARGLQAMAAFTLLYILIYVLMRLEDWALLVGALASFGAIAAVMYFTRRIDWYGAASAAVLPAPSASIPASKDQP